MRRFLQLLLCHFLDESFDSGIDPVLELRFDLGLDEFFEVTVDDSRKEALDSRDDFSSEYSRIDLNLWLFAGLSSGGGSDWRFWCGTIRLRGSRLNQCAAVRFSR